MSFRKMSSYLKLRIPCVVFQVFGPGQNGLDPKSALGRGNPQSLSRPLGWSMSSRLFFNHVRPVTVSRTLSYNYVWRIVFMLLDGLYWLKKFLHDARSHEHPSDYIYFIQTSSVFSLCQLLNRHKTMGLRNAKNEEDLEPCQKQTRVFR